MKVCFTGITMEGKEFKINLPNFLSLDRIPNFVRVFKENEPSIVKVTIEIELPEGEIP